MIVRQKSEGHLNVPCFFVALDLLFATVAAAVFVVAVMTSAAHVGFGEFADRQDFAFEEQWHAGELVVEVDFHEFNADFRPIGQTIRQWFPRAWFTFSSKNPQDVYHRIFLFQNIFILFVEDHLERAFKVFVIL